MKKISNPAAYFSRLQQLAEVNKSVIKDSKNRGIGTLVDYKKSIDGIAYGIIKENHHYYIKKGGVKANPNESDFTYIGGTENITEYQYKSLAEADKKRNMMLNVLNESAKIKSNNTKTKLHEAEVKEDVVDDKLKSMKKSAGNLDTASANEKQKASAPPPSQPSIPDLADNEPIPDSTEPTADLGAEPTADLGAETGTPEGGEQAPTEPISEDDYNETKSELGKAVALFGEKKLTIDQVETILNTIVTPLKKNLIPLEVEQRKDLAAPIIGAEDVNGEEDLENNMPDETEAGLEEGEEGDTTEIEEIINRINDMKQAKGEEPVDAKLLIDKHINNNAEVSENEDEENTEDMECNECGSFGKYAESRGYGRKALLEADNDEKASLISGYINAFNEGKNHGDAKVISVLAKKAIVESLINDYGHKSYVEKQLRPQLKSLNESTFKSRVKLLNEEFEIGTSGTSNANPDEMTDELKKLVAKVGDPEKAKAMLKELIGNSMNETEMDEIFGGLGNAMGAVGSLAKKGFNNATKAVGNAVGNAGKSVVNGVGNATKAVGNAVGNAATAVGDAGKAIGAEYNKEFNTRQRDTSLDTIKSLSSELATAIATVNASRAKLGQPEIKLSAILSHLSNQMRSKSGNVDLGKFKNESKGLPTGTVEVQPNMLQEVEDDDELEIDIDGEAPESLDAEIEAPEDDNMEGIDDEMPEMDSVGFAPDSANMGLDTPDHSGVNIVDVSVDGQNKTVNIKLNEARKALKSLKEAVALANAKGGSAKPAAVTATNTKGTKQEKTGGVALVNAKGGSAKPAAVTATNTKASKQEKTGGVALVNAKGGSAKPSAVTASNTKGTKQEKTDGVALANNNGSAKATAKAKIKGTNKEVKQVVGSKKKVNESEEKVKNYIRAKLQELDGKRKPLLNESVKSATLKKLDSMIVAQYKQSKI